MADKSHIEWTDATWNPLVGCSIVSPGCTNCYAMKMAGRIERMNPGGHYNGTTKTSKAGSVWTGKVALAPDHILTAPLRWKRGRKIFVNSMGDLFHDDIPDEWIDLVVAVMACSGNHTFQLLTKRAARMQQYFAGLTHERVRTAAYKISRCVQYEGRWLFDFPLPNVWLGVSTERQQEADERIADLLATPAAVRFISAEPLLGPIKLNRLFDYTNEHAINALVGRRYHNPRDSEGEKTPALDWVIVGGESGSGARPMHPDWARALRDQCAAAGVPFFFKQWGEWAEWPASEFESEEAESLDVQGRYDYWPALPGVAEMHMRRIGKISAGRLLDGKEHNEIPST